MNIAATVQLRDCRVELTYTGYANGPESGGMCAGISPYMRIDDGPWMRVDRNVSGTHWRLWMETCLDRAGVEEWMSW